ncbi:MAG: aspartate aminotransferase family protein [Bacteroidales bacterium]
MNQPTDGSEERTVKDQQIYERAIKVMPGGLSRNVLLRQQFPRYVDRASGAYVTDTNGVTRIDFANNIASMIHGHAHPAIVEAVCEQVRKGTAFNLGTEVEVSYAELLCNRVPGFEKLRFVNSGTEAVMAMLKAARAYTGRPKIAKAEGGYHGSYDTAEISQSASPANWGSIDSPNSVPHVYGTPEGVTDNVVIYPFNDTERTIKILDRHKDEIACVLVDPMPHRIGLIKADDEFMEALRKWTTENGALLCFDEVICFRVEYEGAQSLFKVKPDLTSMGKIIGGGFPIGAFAGKTEIMNVLDPTHDLFRFALSGTFSANPISLTAGKVTMEMLDREAVKKINRMTTIAIRQVTEAGKVAGIPLSITGSGSMFKVHFREDPPRSYRDVFEDEKAQKVNRTFLKHLFDEGVMLIYSCSCVLSTVITQKEIDILSDAMLSAFRRIKPML